MIAEIPILQMLSFLVLGISSILTYMFDFKSLDAKADAILDKWENALSRAEMEVPKDSIVRSIFGIVFLIALIALMFSIVAAITVSVLLVLIIVFGIKFRIKSLDKQAQENSDEMCFSLARALRAGKTLEASIYDVSTQYSKSALIMPLSELLSKGVSFSQAIDFVVKNNASNSNSDSVLFLSAVHIAHSMGGNSARIFEKIGDYYASIYELRRDCAASLSQVKLSTLMISLLPLVMLLFSAMIGTDTLAFLFTNPIGIVCLAVGLLFQTSGLYWMKQQIHKGVSQWIS